VLHTSPTSLRINQCAHTGTSTSPPQPAFPYATDRPAIFSASLLAAGPEIRASRTWTGPADGLHPRRQERHAGLQPARTGTPTWRPPQERPGHGSRGISSGSPETERIMTEAFTRKPSVHRPPPVPATAADIMRPALATVEPRVHAAAAAYLMKHAGVTALVVVDDDQAKQPVGIITEADIVQAVADGKDLNDVRIQALITTHPTVISAGTSIQDAARFMVTGHFRHLPVVVGEAGLIGMVDITDVCAALLDPPQDHLLATRDRRTPGRPGGDRTHRTSEQKQRCAS
jgi:CBS domain-containing protein